MICWCYFIGNSNYNQMIGSTQKWKRSLNGPEVRKSSDVCTGNLRSVSIYDLLCFLSGVATGGMGGSGPPTSVQTPPEICANPLRSVLCIGGPMHVYCNILLLTSNNNKFGPPLFLGWLRHCVFSFPDNLILFPLFFYEIIEKSFVVCCQLM